ncbi:MAG: F0F1 ATP synthase subunit A, partial [Alphaproteobacteria bacterium]|nr:F0F1 ATP synthase subunit A [Alphaproteobacteria bacterium]
NFTFTSQIIVTFGLAIIAFGIATFVGFVRHGFHYFSLFVPQGAPVYMLPLIVPIELLSYLSRPVSLSIRLFANMMAGHTMLKVFAGFTVLLGVFGIAPLTVNILLTAFEILVAVLQAYVFTILTCIYLHDAIHLH